MLSGQKAHIIIEYDYKLINMDLRSFVISNDTDSYFMFVKREKNLTYEDLETTDFKEINSYHIFNYNHETSEMYQLPTLLPKPKELQQQLLVDVLEAPKWRFAKESQKILGYNCTLATTTFRGRNYKAWFTTEIPMAVFPWKLKGLPGAILAFEDDKGYFSGIATRVKMNTDMTMPKRIAEFFSLHKKSALPYRTYIEMENRRLTLGREERNANYPVGTQVRAVHPREMSYEKEFEWETGK